MYVQYSSPDESVVLKATNHIGFFGSTLGQSIDVGSYQGITAQVGIAGTAYSGSFPNVKYVDSTHCDFGTGTQLLTQVPFESCTLRLRIQASGSLTSLRISGAKLLAHSGSVHSATPVNMNVYGFEKGNSTWTLMSGATGLVLTPHTSSGSYVHDYYVCLSMTPTARVKGSVSLSLYLESY